MHEFIYHSDGGVLRARVCVARGAGTAAVEGQRCTGIRSWPSDLLTLANNQTTGAWQFNRPCAQTYVGKSESCMVISGRLIVHEPILLIHCVKYIQHGLTNH
eukprot:COSAG05_NODE_520_length_9047_cov_2.500224_8_plen_102_part_00